MKLKDQIRAILDQELAAEEQTITGLPAHPTITGKDVAVEKIAELIHEFLTKEDDFVCGANVKSCVYYRNGGECVSNESCRFQKNKID